jgi:hypothetical protein
MVVSQSQSSYGSIIATLGSMGVPWSERSLLRVAEEGSSPFCAIMVSWSTSEVCLIAPTNKAKLVRRESIANFRLYVDDSRARLIEITLERKKTHDHLSKKN